MRQRSLCRFKTAVHARRRAPQGFAAPCAPSFGGDLSPASLSFTLPILGLGPRSRDLGIGLQFFHIRATLARLSTGILPCERIAQHTALSSEVHEIFSELTPRCVVHGQSLPTSYQPPTTTTSPTSGLPSRLRDPTRESFPFIHTFNTHSPAQYLPTYYIIHTLWTTYLFVWTAGQLKPR